MGEVPLYMCVAASFGRNDAGRKRREGGRVGEREREGEGEGGRGERERYLAHKKTAYPPRTPLGP